MSQIFVFTGENGFQLRKERHLWAEKFTQKHGPENLVTFAASGALLRTLLDEIGTAPFIAEKRLVVVDGIPKFSKEEMRVLPGSIHADCILLFCEEKPDKRLSGVKELLSFADVKEFPMPRGKVLEKWLVETARSFDATMASDAIALFLDLLGDDQELLSQELKKLALFKRGGTIAREDVERLTVPSAEREIWHLTSLLSEGKTEEALMYSRRLIERGEDPHALWNILLWFLRSFVAVHGSVASGETNPMRIASATKVIFPTAKALLALSRRTDVTRVRTFLDRAVAADIDLKTGGYRATQEAPEELIALIDRFILDFKKMGDPVAR